MSLYPTPHNDAGLALVTAPLPATTPDPLTALDHLAAMHGHMQNLLIAVRTLKPDLLAQINGIPVVGAGDCNEYTFRVDEAYVTCFALKIVNSSAAVQYVNIESPASVVTDEIAVGATYTYNLTAFRRIYIYSAAGVIIYPVAGQNVGAGNTGLYVQAWTNAEWSNMRGSNA